MFGVIDNHLREYTLWHTDVSKTEGRTGVNPKYDMSPIDRSTWIE